MAYTVRFLWIKTIKSPIEPVFYFTEIWKERNLDKVVTSAALVMDLSKTSDCLPHDLLIAKLHAYGINENSLEVLVSYLTNGKKIELF